MHKCYSWWRHQMETVCALLAISGNSPYKGQWRGALMFSLICVWINGWVNNGEAGDMRRYRAHYDVTVMWWHVYLQISHAIIKFRQHLLLGLNMCYSSVRFTKMIPSFHCYFDNTLVLSKADIIIMLEGVYQGDIAHILIVSWNILILYYRSTFFIC